MVNQYLNKSLDKLDKSIKNEDVFSHIASFLFNNYQIVF